MSEKKVALISGANKGIGLETGRQLGKLGYTILLGSRDALKGEVAARQLRDDGVDARVVKLDVVRQADIDAVAKLIASEFGKLDVLVNNAGAMIEKSWTKNSTSETKIADLRATFETNLFAVLALTQALLPLLKKAEAARIVNVSSILGSVSLQATKGSPTYDTKLFAYNSSKAALNVFTIHLAHELLGTKIKVNSAHPGWVHTDMGGSAAPMNVVEGAKTEVQLATLPEDGPTGGFFHLGKEIAW
ncbi:SDR family oxidoreductase [Granulicella mallensis]|jgi:NAD(P)-dependent dehydrogenase (short-subunit alcohol dehydrogenase family)|uniref:NAD(P)-dependent dehydrogenase (Short-subunit alcohol dehydrogenase family) n=1 Tax=Granulicella mallensis TaxID=940614 RepID=A0A7W7ZS93_9BACT|nr:SDR family oxidoreductase [Granulicella mallensis]MBB5064843.1 NAD(P)-dependent dehydrogenase (short-subunit alcohol dehydrogenase family) [Granulicella mallensis]